MTSSPTLARYVLPSNRTPRRGSGVAQSVATAPDGTLTLRRETLGLELRAAPGREMRFRDPATGDDLRSHDEEVEARLDAEARAADAEARVAELEALLRKPSG